MKTLLLIDNQDITREGMKTVAGRIGGFAAIKEAGSQSELTGLLVDNPNAVAVLDYTLFDTSAEYLLILQERFKEAHFVLFSDNLSEDFIRRMVFSGTSFSVVMKDAPMIEIEEGLRKAKQHLQYMCTRAVWLLQHKEDKKDKLVSPLTVTEREILKLMALGKTTKEIAAERFPKCIYGNDSPQKYLSQAGSEQCARSNKICPSCRDCGCGGILYLG